MKNCVWIALLCWAFSSCGSGANKDVVKTTTDSSATDSLPATIIAGGTKTTYPFPPDSAINRFVLGNLDSLQNIADEIGVLTPNKLPGGISTLVFGNNHNQQQLTVFMHYGNAASTWAPPYRFVVAPYDSTVEPELRPRRLRDMNLLSSYGIFLGMNKDMLLHVYRGQEFSQRMQNDTLVLTYVPEPQDSIYFKKYDWNTYRAEFRFKDDVLHHIEYTYTPHDH